MSKFKPGNRVRRKESAYFDLDRKVRVVIDTPQDCLHFDCDDMMWFIGDDGHAVWSNENNFELAEDEYEYCVYDVTNNTVLTGPMSIEDASDGVMNYNEFIRLCGEAGMRTEGRAKYEVRRRRISEWEAFDE